jgi:hypothetical protein
VRVGPQLLRSIALASTVCRRRGEPRHRLGCRARIREIRLRDERERLASTARLGGGRLQPFDTLERRIAPQAGHTFGEGVSARGGVVRERLLVRHRRLCGHVA